MFYYTFIIIFTFFFPIGEVCSTAVTSAEIGFSNNKAGTSWTSQTTRWVLWALSLSRARPLNSLPFSRSYACAKTTICLCWNTWLHWFSCFIRQTCKQYDSPSFSPIPSPPTYYFQIFENLILCLNYKADYTENKMVLRKLLRSFPV